VHYLRFYVGDYARARRVVKSRLRRHVVWTASANGGIAVAGTAVAVWEQPWLGLVSTALAGLIGVLAAWDSLARHRELWIQRAAVLAELLAIKRDLELANAAGEDRREAGLRGMERLNVALSRDHETWAEVVQTQASTQATNAAVT